MDEKTLIVLHRELRGVTDNFAHDTKWGGEQGRCKKCHTSTPYKSRCKLPDPFTNKDGSIASLADIAEEIRVWMEKQPDTLRAKWIRSLYDIPWKQANSIQFGAAVGVILVFILKTTPTDKIKAFVSLFKENRP